MTKEAGYECAITVDLGFNDSGTDSFRLKRIAMRGNAGIYELAVRVTGLWGYLKRILRIPTLPKLL